MNWLWPLAGAVAGSIVGSFLATLILRWPRGEQALTGRSRCDHCHAEVPIWAMVPVVSFLAVRGKCAACGARIDPLHVGVELAAALLGATALALQPNAQGVAVALFWLMMLAPAVLDARHMWLPDVLTAFLAVGGLLFGGLVSEASVGDRLIGGVAGFASLALLGTLYGRARAREGLGQGDPKLLGAIGIWTGWAALPAILLLAALAGLGAALAGRRGRLDRMPFGTLMILAAIIWSGLAAAGYRLPPR